MDGTVSRPQQLIESNRKRRVHSLENEIRCRRRRADYSLRALKFIVYIIRIIIIRADTDTRTNQSINVLQLQGWLMTVRGRRASVVRCQTSSFPAKPRNEFIRAYSTGLGSRIEILPASGRQARTSRGWRRCTGPVSVPPWRTACRCSCEDPIRTGCTRTGSGCACSPRPSCWFTTSEG